MIRLFTISLVAASAVIASAETLPSAADVLKRVQARMDANYADSPANRYEYNRTNVIEEFDSSGKLKERTVKAYEVVQIQGLPRAKLVMLDGRALSPSEQKWRVGEEQRLHRALAQDKAPDYSKPKPWLTDDIIDRFEFRVTGRTNRFQRPILMLEFTPRKGAPSRSMVDRVVNKISGGIWVDESESEIARMDLRMTEPAKFWGGIIGQLDRFNFTLHRARSPFGVWFNENSSGLIQIRKLFTSTRYKFSEQSTPLKRSGT